MKNIVCLFAFFCMFNLSAEVKIRPLPWFTEGAIAFLKEHLEKHPESRILEYGSGASTIYLASRVCELVSVEHDPKWHKLIKGRIEKLPFPTTHIKCVLRKRPYNNIASEFPNEYFDLILVDGRDRVKCIESSLSKLKKGGVLLLDNSERHRYFSGISLLKDWERFDAKQIKKDACGFCYKGWLTSWWIKPS